MTFFNTEDKSAIATDLSVKLAKLVVHELDEAANSMPGGIDVKETEDCSTPTASEHKIPDVLTCPPAPRKRKAIFLSMKNIGNDKFRKVNNLFVSSNSGSLLAFDQISCEKVEWNSK